MYLKLHILTFQIIFVFRTTFFQLKMEDEGEEHLPATLVSQNMSERLNYLQNDFYYFICFLLLLRRGGGGLIIFSFSGYLFYNDDSTYISM